MESHVESAFRDRLISDAALDQLESAFDAISGKIEALQDSLHGAIEENRTAAVTISEPVQPPTEATGLLQSKTLLRINSELIDRLVSDAGEASILRAKIEAQLSSFKQSLQDLTESTHRLHDQLREVEIQAETQMQSHLAQQHDSEHTFDPLEFDRFTRFQELTRLMAESVDDIVTVQKNLRSTQTAAEEAVAQQAVINRQLQQSLLQIRTIPFSNYAERYYRIARQVAEDLGKKVNFEIHGAEVDIDRSVLEKINPPLEHLLRNAIAHGIEEPAQRRQAGKPEHGQVVIQLRQAGNEVSITLSDDGCGLNLPRIREEALRLGLIQQNEVLDDGRIMSLIFTQGLSTTDSVTGIAGRGIGLDIVKNEIAMLGGRISVQSVAGQGTAFAINLPLTLSVAQTLMVRSGKQTYAIPAFIVEHQREFDPDTLQKIYQDRRITLNGITYPFSHLSHLLGEIAHIPETARHSQVLFLHSGAQYLAVHADELLGSDEVVVKNMGAQLAQAPGVEGATITGDGEVILILNPVKLLQRSDVQSVLNTPAAGPAPAQRKKTASPPAVMVVDDSLTVRKVTCRLLEREGCDVLIAKNGAEAVEILHETTPDVMLIDLEMPKMNGFELIKKVRANPATAHMPVIIISSRTAEKHRKIAKDLDVNVFLGKPYKEEELLNHLSDLLGNCKNQQ
jgi:chemosensory pili system protein ChpA (sensor histidine kinase/response regulator)